MKKTTSTIIILVVVSFATSISAQDNFSYSGTRPLSLGRAFIGSADDENALFYNSAGLTQVQFRKITLSGIYQYYSWEYEISLLSGINPNYSERGFSLSYIMKSFGISYTLMGNGWWDNLEIGNVYTPGETFRVKPVYYDHSVTAAYAREVYSGLSLGVTAKYMHSVNPYEGTPSGAEELIENQHGVTFGLGILYSPLEYLSFGLNVDNILFSKINYVVPNDFGMHVYMNKLPRNVSFGLAYHPHRNVSLLADVRNLLEDGIKDIIYDADFAFKRSYHVGCEWRVIPEIIIRAGYFHDRRWSDLPDPTCSAPFECVYGPFGYDSYHNFTFGIGLRYRNYHVDFGMKADNRKSKMEENPIRLRDNTLMGAVSLAIVI
jgi:hypothetical protein